MKNKIKYILLIIIIIILIIVLFIHFSNKNNFNDIKISFQEETEKIELDKSTNELFKELYNYGVQVFDSKEYKRFDKKNNIYFISLYELNKKYDYDISNFKGSDGTVCDIDNSGIFFDIDHKIPTNNDKDVKPVIPILIGCTKEEQAYK